MSQVKQAWLEFLGPVYWEWFITVTFKRERKDTYYALNVVESVFKHYYSDGKAFLGAEYHKSGNVHVHGVCTPARRPAMGGRIHNPDSYPFWNGLFTRCGRSSVVPPIQKADVIKYVTKYCTKDLTDYRILGKLR